MKKNKGIAILKGIRPAFVLCLIALVLLCVGYKYYFATLLVFGEPTDRWAVVFTVAAILSLAFLTVDGFLCGEGVFSFVFTAAAVVFTVLAMCLYLMPFLDKIAVFYTVHDMGDVATMEIGVPLCIRGVAMYLVSALLTVLSAFFAPMKKGGSVLDVCVGEEKV